MKQFVALYFLFLALLFGLFYAPLWEVSTFLNAVQTNMTLYALGLFLTPEQFQGIDIWINPHYKIVINKACNGMIPILFLFASVLAYPSSWAHKMFWMSFGYMVFFVTNVGRILLVVYVTQTGRGQGDFYWSHDLVGNALLMLTGLALFIGFIKSAKRQTNTAL